MLKLISSHLDSVPPLLLLLFALWSGKVAWRRDYIFWFIVAQAFFNSFAGILDLGLNRPNLFLYHANCAVSFFILSLYFAQSLQIKIKKQIFTSVFLLFTAFFLLNLVLWEGINSFNSNTYSLASIILVTYCLLYYLEELMHPGSSYISKARDFWYVTGIFTYYAGASGIFITYRYLTQHRIISDGTLWMLHNGVFLIMCVYFLVGILCKPSQERSRL